MQLAKDELEVQCIRKPFLETQKNMLVLGKMQEILDYIDSYNANSKVGQLHRTRPWYLDKAYLKCVINEKNLFIKKL